MTPTEIIADVCAAPWVDRAHQAEFIVARLEHDGWEIRRKGESDPWPPPKPGTHESDLYAARLIDDLSDEIFPSNYARARRWSIDNNPERNA